MSDPSSTHAAPATAAIVPFPATAALQAKRLTQDGPIWPVPRPDMRAGARIIERMAEDAASLVREHGDIEPIAEAHFIALGWLPSQVRLYGESAMRRMRDAARRKAGLHDQGETARGEDAPGAAAFDAARNADNANEVA